MVSFMCELFGCLIFNTTTAPCGLYLQAFEWSLSKPTSSAVTCSIPLKNVIIKDSYQKIASNRIAMHFYFECSWARRKRKIMYRHTNHNECNVVFRVNHFSCKCCQRFSAKWQLRLCGQTEWKWFDHLLVFTLKQDWHSRQALWSINCYLPYLWETGNCTLADKCLHVYSSTSTIWTN